MKLHELRSEGMWSFVLDVHPEITVVVGLGRERRLRLAAMAAAVLRGELEGVTSTVEIESEIVELTPALAMQYELGVDPPDLILGPEDLPDAIVMVPEEEPPPAPVVDPNADAVDPLILAKFHFTDVRQSEIDGPLADHWRRVQETWQHGAELARQVEAARGQIDDSPKQMLSRAEAVLAQARARHQDARAGLDAAIGPAQRLEQALSRRMQLQEARQETVQLLEDDLPDPAPVERAIRDLEDAELDAAEPRISPEAVALADAWVEIQERIQAHPIPSPPAWLVDQTKELLDNARADMVQAEAILRATLADDADVAALERAHAETVEAEQSLDGFMSGPRARKRLEAALVVEQELLARIGVPSYEAFFYQRATHGGDVDAAESALERARRMLIDAEAVWEELHTPQDDPVMKALRDEEQQLRARAVEMLGTDPGVNYLEFALREHHDLPPDIGPARGAVVSALDAVGVSADESNAMKVAVQWLTEFGERAELQKSAQERLANIEVELEQVEGLIEEAKSSIAAGDDDSVVGHLQVLEHGVATAERAENDATEEYGIALKAVEAYEASMQAVQEMEEQVVEAEANYQQARADFLIAQNRLREAEAAAASRVTRWDQPFRTPAVVDLSEVDPAEVEVYVLARIAALRSVGLAGSLPLIVNDAFAGMPVASIRPTLDLLSRVSKVVQIIFLSDQPEIEAWAAGLGSEAATVRRFAGL